MKNMNCVNTMPEIMPEITDEAIIEALFAQRPYEEKVINSAFLEIPAEYQRKLNIPNVEKMSAEFTELIANPPKVSYRDGHYFVFDGQHTIVTRRAMNGGQDLPIICKVYEGLTEEEEAMLFSRQTGVSTPLLNGSDTLRHSIRLMCSTSVATKQAMFGSLPTVRAFCISVRQTEPGGSIHATTA